MSGQYTITLEDEPSRADRDRISDGLAEFNLLHAGPINVRHLCVFVREPAGVLAGGLVGVTYWNWLAVDLLWLRDDLRGQGYGSRLLAMAEEEAVRRGCLNAHVDTFDFQALTFYQRYGYTVFGQLDGLPPGHVRYYLSKTLARPASPPV